MREAGLSEGYAAALEKRRLALGGRAAG
jgi:hypothetical protein